MEKIFDMIVVGGGPGGYTAALYGARAGLDVLVIERLSAGGQMNLTGQIDNYPGFPEGVDGFQLSMNMQQGAERFGAKTKYAEVLKLELSGDIKSVQTNEGIYQTKTVVISTGAGPRQLGVAREDKMIGRGVGYCAHCDGMFYRGKTVVVVGGGNSAVAEALYLSRIAKEVILVHRRDSLRATQIYLKPLQEASNIRFVAAKAGGSGCFYQRRQTACHGAGERAVDFRPGRLYHGRRRYENQYPRCVCGWGCADEGAAPDRHGGGGRGYGCPYGGTVSCIRRQNAISHLVF